MTAQTNNRSRMALTFITNGESEMRVAATKHRRSLLSTILVIFLPATFVFNFAACFGKRDCGEQVLDSVKSPTDIYVAVIMRRNCHATAPFVTHVNIRQSDREFSTNPDDGQIADGMVLSVIGEFPIQLVWLSDKKLKVVCSDCIKSDLIRKTSSWNDVEIIHELVENNSKPSN
jgi:hypothetical protein